MALIKITNNNCSSTFYMTVKRKDDKLASKPLHGDVTLQSTHFGLVDCEGTYVPQQKLSDMLKFSEEC